MPTETKGAFHLLKAHYYCRIIGIEALCPDGCGCRRPCRVERKARLDGSGNSHSRERLDELRLWFTCTARLGVEAFGVGSGLVYT
jgi:hypothetical protein